MARRCTTTVGWVTKLDSAEMVGIGCDEYRDILIKLAKGYSRTALSDWEKAILAKAEEQGW